MSGRRRRNQRSDSHIDFDFNGTANSTRRFNSEDQDFRVKINFTDAENTIRKFNGSETMSIKKWLTEFDQYATVFGWNDLQKFIFCKRSLLGPAKLFVEYEAKPLNYIDLKQALIAEFQEKITSAEVHAKLRERRKRHDETFREFLYCMVDIASQIEMEESSVINYIIEGIKDSPVNKMVLYGAKTLPELKDKLIIYEKISKGENYKVMTEKRSAGKPKFEISNRKYQRYCFNCGSNEHEFHNCPKKNKGPKCFGCNKFGHKRPDCPEKINSQATTAASANLVESKNNMYIEVKINNIKFHCLVDTGSDICLLKQCYFKLINSGSNFRNKILMIAGLGTNILQKVLVT